MPKKSAPLFALAFLAVLAMLPSCSTTTAGGSLGTTGSSNVPSAPVRTVLTTRSFSLRPLESIFLDVPVTGNGTLDASANWTLAANDVDLWATTTACANAEQLVVGSCTGLAKATGPTAKPERVSLAVTSGTYRFFVINRGPGAESGTIEVGLTQ